MIQRWEYQIINYEDTFTIPYDQVEWRQKVTARLNAQGELGWELVIWQVTNVGEKAMVYSIWRRQRT